MVLRTLTALVGLPVLLIIVWFGFPWFAIAVSAIALVAWWEYHRMFSPAGHRLILIYGGLWAVALVVTGQLVPEWTHADLPLLLFAVVGGGAAVALLWYLGSERVERLPHRAFLAMGPIYVGFLLAHALALRDLESGGDAGRNWLIFALLATFATDSGALLVGRPLGRHTMAPSISPGKTWEGAAGGLVCALAAGAGIAALLDLPMGWALGISALVGVAGQTGDLAESRLKRIAGVKDSGVIIPGHGGILDRLDSVVVTIPVVYYLVVLAVEP